MIILKLRTDELTTEDGVAYTAYGVDVIYPDGRTVSISDVSLSRQKVEELVQLCNSLEVSECHVMDVVGECAINDY